MHHKGPRRISVFYLKIALATALNTYSKYSQDDKKYDLKEVPVAVVSDLKEDEFPCAERVHCLFNKISERSNV